MIIIAVVLVGGFFAAIAILFVGAAISVRPLFQLSKQQRTVEDIRAIGLAMITYEGQNLSYPNVQSYEQLRPLLVPKYIRAMPANDHWGHPFRYACIKVSDDRCVAYALGSPGRDGVFAPDDLGAIVAADPGPTTNFDCDIVYTSGRYGGRFVEYPSGTQK